MNTFLQGLLYLFNAGVEIYIWLLIGSVIMSWLVAFNVINTHNQFVHSIWYFLSRITDPPLNYIRRFMPGLGGIDLSPIILILLLHFSQILVNGYLGPLAYGY